MRTDTRNVKGRPESYDAVPPHITAFTERLRQAGYCGG